MKNANLDSFESLDAALLHACEQSDASMASAALRRRANPDAVNHENASAALIASHVGAAACLAKLIARGASLKPTGKHFSPSTWRPWLDTTHAFASS